MTQVLYVLAAVIAITLDVASLAFLVRAVMPIFCDVENSRVYLFASLVTEPFIIPVRFLLVKFNLLQDTPMDWSFIISYLILSFVRMLLPII